MSLVRKTALALLSLAATCLAPGTALAVANYVYHEQTNNFVATPTDEPGGGCGGGTESQNGRNQYH